MFSSPTKKLRLALCVCVALFALGGAATASAQDSGGDGDGGGSSSGGAAFIPPPPPPQKATIWHGQALAPAGAPERVKQVIAWGNQIIGKPYVYGGGHRAYSSRRRALKLERGYDCSGSVSHALMGGAFLRTPLDSSSFMDWGQSGPGTWITVYTNSGHAYLVVAGLRLDTGMRDDPSRTGPAWSKKLRRSASFIPRHPRGF